MSARPILCYITDSSRLPHPEQLLEHIRAAFRAGVDWVQIREKQMPVRELCRLVEQAAALPEKAGGRLLVNERLDVALSCGAAGVHLPADSLPIPAVCAKVPKDWLVGVSCHAPAEVEAAAREGASFAVLGPIFETPGKGPPLGLAALREACALVASAGFPVLALGGVTVDNAQACFDAGAAGIAAIRLFQTQDVERVVRQLWRGDEG